LIQLNEQIGMFDRKLSIVQNSAVIAKKSLAREAKQKNQKLKDLEQMKQ
jgi:hypothetical protein